MLKAIIAIFFSGLATVLDHNIIEYESSPVESNFTESERGELYMYVNECKTDLTLSDFVIDRLTHICFIYLYNYCRE